MIDIAKTRLVEDVPDLPANERFYLWSGAERKTVWKGRSMAEGREWAADNSITIDVEEPFEP